jgi:light-regulated signal transduction histidine kinase (bacteriophytochrome)
MRKSSVDLRDTVESVINSMSQETGGRDIKWKIYWLPVVEANQNMLRLEFQNILGNAVKYTRPMERAVIEIGGRLNDGEAVISVRDNGVGFDMKYSDNLFGVFQRVHSSEIFEGSGIGLANVRRIIHRHGGRTWAEGEVDRGAAIYFSLPASKKG